MILEVHQEITGLLGHPRARGMGGDSGQVHAPGVMLNEEQQRTGGARTPCRRGRSPRRGSPSLGLQERPLGLPGPSGCRVDVRLLEDLPRLCRAKTRTLL